MMAPVEPNVSIIYLDTVMPGNRIEIGRGRVITGSGRRFSVPLSYFEGEFMTPLTSRLLQRRSFLVLDGLTDDQRELYGCLYRPGEVIFSEGSFGFFLRESEELLPALAALCPEHRDMVLRRVLTAREENNLSLSRGTLVSMNKLSRLDHNGYGLLEELIKSLEE